MWVYFVVVGLSLCETREASKNRKMIDVLNSALFYVGNNVTAGPLFQERHPAYLIGLPSLNIDASEQWEVPPSNE